MKNSSSSGSTSMFTDNLPSEEQMVLQGSSRNLSSPNILLVGQGGSGKSSLVNHIFQTSDAPVGFGRSVTQDMTHYSLETRQASDEGTNEDDAVNVGVGGGGSTVVLFDSKGLEMNYWMSREKDTNREASASGRNKLIQFLNEMAKVKNPLNKLHIVWYLVPANGLRFSEADKDICENLLGDYPVFIILTKCDLVCDEQIMQMRQTIDQMNVRNCYGIYLSSIYAEQNRVVSSYTRLCVNNCLNHTPTLSRVRPQTLFCSECKSSQSACLFCNDAAIVLDVATSTWYCKACHSEWDAIRRVYLDWSIDLIDSCYRLLYDIDSALAISFSNSLLDRSRSERYRIVASAAAIAAATATAATIAAIPIPFSDCFLIVPTQMILLASIASIWSFQLSKHKRNWGFVISKTLLGPTASFFGMQLANVLKMIPGANVVGCGINAGIASSITAAVGIMYTIAFAKIWKKQVEEGAVQEQYAEEVLSNFVSFNFFRDVLNSFKLNFITSFTTNTLVSLIEKLSRRYGGDPIERYDALHYAQEIRIKLEDMFSDEPGKDLSQRIENSKREDKKKMHEIKQFVDVILYTNSCRSKTAKAKEYYDYLQSNHHNNRISNVQ